MDPNKEYRIRIERDDPIESPRDWDNLGTMVCWHRRYNLGDEQPSEPPTEWGSNLRAAIYLPLYLIDHSGISMSTDPFHCPFDSGQVGWIYVTKDKVRMEGLDPDTEEGKAQVLQILESEVAVYDQYLTGDIYSFVVESRPKQVYDADGNPLDVEVEWDIEDSCGGFYGDDPFENGMAEHIDEELHDLLKEAA